MAAVSQPKGQVEEASQEQEGQGHVARGPLERPLKGHNVDALSGPVSVIDRQRLRRDPRALSARGLCMEAMVPVLTSACVKIKNGRVDLYARGF